MNTTNLIAAISVLLSTNTVETITGYARQVVVPCPDAKPPDKYGLSFNCLVTHWQGVDPNEKTITTTAQKKTTLSFNWMGKAQTIEHVETLWSSHKVVRLEWREVTPVYSSTNLVTWDTATNWVIITNRLDRPERIEP